MIKATKDGYKIRFDPLKLFKKIKRGFYRIIMFFNENSSIVPDKERTKILKKNKKKKGHFFSSILGKIYKWIKKKLDLRDPELDNALKKKRHEIKKGKGGII